MHIKTSCSDIIVNLVILYTYNHAILCDLSYEIVGIYFLEKADVTFVFHFI
jgi:hypothetical protein